MIRDAHMSLVVAMVERVTYRVDVLSVEALALALLMVRHNVLSWAKVVFAWVWDALIFIVRSNVTSRCFS